MGLINRGQGRRAALFVAALTLALLLAAGRAHAAVSSPTWFPLSPPSAPPARGNAAAAYDPATQQFVVVGGAGNGILAQGDTWTWSGMSWQPSTPALAPAPRIGARMAFDAATGQLILFGGYSGSGQNDTWTWNGFSWRQLRPATSPPPTSNEAMAYDPATKQLLIFGGYQYDALGNATPQNATWAWDGTTWTQLHPTTQPSARINASMSWDPATSQLILFGGSTATTYFSGTWAWNGSTWTALAPAARPSARAGASLAYDPDTAQMLMLGGLNGTGVLSDVWTWSGTTWAQQTPSRALPARYLASVDYDSATRQLIVFGGASGAGGYLGDTWLWTPFAIGQPSLPPGTAGLRYRSGLTAIAGTAPATWSVSAGALPAGLTLSPFGILSGTPQTAGVSSFTVSVTDAAGHTATRAYSLTVNPSPIAGVWVSSAANSTLHAYALNATGAATPTVTLGGASTQLNAPGGLVLDATGGLYVANSGTPSITYYAAGSSGNAPPLRTLAGPSTGLAYPSGIALDPAGRLYVADGAASTVRVYAAGASGNQAPIANIAGPNTTLLQPVGVVIDAQGHIWVADAGHDSLIEFAATANGDVGPLAKIAGSNTGLNEPIALAQDSTGRLLVSNLFGQSVTGFANGLPYGNTDPDLTIFGGASPLSLPRGLDVNAADDLYVATQNQINVYTGGTSTLQAVITGLLAPNAVTVAPPTQIVTRTLPIAGLGRRYASRVFAALGAPPLRWRVVRGHLPPGLRLSASGQISGTARHLGTYRFTVQVSGPLKRLHPLRRALAISVARAPVLRSLTPSHGRLTAGTPVTITGSGFARGDTNTVVRFGRIVASRVRCRTRSVCVVRAPAHAAGRVDVTVTVGGLTSRVVAAGRFRYTR